MMDEDKRDKILINCLVALFIGALLLLTVNMISEERHSVHQQEKVNPHKARHVERPRYIEDTVVTPEFEDKGEQHTYIGRGDGKPALAFGDGDVGMYEDPDRGFRLSHAIERGEGLITCDDIVLFGTDDLLFTVRYGNPPVIEIKCRDGLNSGIGPEEDNTFAVYKDGKEILLIKFKEEE